MHTPNCFDQDWHVSSTFSDGSATVGDYVVAAEVNNLKTLCVVDRARRSSPWVRELASACRAADRTAPLAVRSGIEVEVLDTNGTMELPAFAPAVDCLFVAADRLPTPRGPVDPDEARGLIEAGGLLPARAVEWLVRAYANATRAPGKVVLAQPFRLLGRLGLSSETVHPSYIRWLARVMLENHACSEVSESWRTPSRLAVDCFLTAGVPVLPASGARSTDGVGRHDWYRSLQGELSSLARAA